MFYQLPPVGNPICLCPHADASTSSLFSSYKIQFYASGTAALAAAILVAIKQKKSKNIDSNISDNIPEIILPAYACPDLISAVVYAGGKPVLVDLEADRPWLELAQLSSAITVNTAAIIAVNLFGISERWSQLRKLAKQQNIVLIEDSAQYFPAGENLSQDRVQDWQGDLVVLSFGRGKPVSLLGGGAVLTKKAALYEHLPNPGGAASGLIPQLSFGLKARLYNFMISPLIYWLPQSLPFLHLGETRYHALSDIEGLDQVRLELLKGNISRYQNDAEAITRCEKISAILDSQNAINNLPRLCNMKANHRLLRYPLLLDATHRNKVYQKLKQAGLGASILYPTSLPKIAGLKGILDDKLAFPNAEMFASRLLTLPTHSHVSEKDIGKINTILKQVTV